MSKRLKKRAPITPALWAALMGGLGVGIRDCAAQEKKTMALAFSQIPVESGGGVGCNAKIAETLLGERYVRGGRVVVRAALNALNALGVADVAVTAGAVRVVSVGFAMAADPAFSVGGRLVHPGPEPLDDEVLDLFRTWIDLGAQFDDACPVGAWPHAIGPPGNEESGLTSGSN